MARHVEPITDAARAAEALARLFDEHEHAVFFGGAGVSTASGIPDFRSVDGLYSQHFAYPPETMLSHSFFETHPAEFFRFYRERMIALDAKPNACHLKLAELERMGKLDAVVTQNIDGLHQLAGSKRVWELHGSVHRNICQRCGAVYAAEQMTSRELEDAEGIPRCSACGGVIKPDVVLYEEPLDETVIEGAVHAIARADMLIIGGTSLVVYPAAGLTRYFQGDTLVIVNRDATPQDAQADILISCDIARAFSF
ncbi:NAD-dependent protein deacylase [uncultured Enorma sp.]|uniref:NAD-dependent protein deacylase n=1 Tax=uncultured Enorma sp. TaxID=1714346 RepID=UPI00265FD9E9|nr:NAD-dependent protein deacylase [uncultured Enorma sp.]